MCLLRLASGTNIHRQHFNNNRGITKKSTISKQQTSNAIEAYLQNLPEEYRITLQVIREISRSGVPEAVEAMVYGVPGFKLTGKSLVCYATFKKHCGFYPMNKEVIGKFEHELAGFETAKGTIRFLPQPPLPKALLEKIVTARVLELE